MGEQERKAPKSESEGSRRVRWESRRERPVSWSDQKILGEREKANRESDVDRTDVRKIKEITMKEE